MVRIIQDNPVVEIMSSLSDLSRQRQRIEEAGRTCYQSQDKITRESVDEFIAMLIRRGHESVLEHSTLTVRFTDCSRGMTHELVRHRLASFSQESTRYVDESDLHFVMPSGKDPDAKIKVDKGGQWGQVFKYESPKEMIEMMETYYRLLLKSGWKKEDARQFLPIGVTSQIVVSANWREWRHILKLRTDLTAHWEIRTAMRILGSRLLKLLPGVFNDVVTL